MTDKRTLTGVDEWVEKLAKEDMLAMTQTVDRISGIVADEDSSASELACAILHDPAIASKVLKIANSAYFNTSGNTINTVSRAVVVLGYEAARDICVSLGVIDSFLEGNPRERLLKHVAKSFHAAIQAQNLAQQRGDKDSEEIFISAFLYELGHQALWCHGGEVADQLEFLLNSSHLPPEEAERQVLGFTLNELTKGLATEWKLGDSLQNALEQGDDPKSRWHSIKLGYELADSVGENGWSDATEVNAVISKIAEYLGRDPLETRKLLQENADRAVDKFSHFHHNDSVAKLIPQVTKSASNKKKTTDSTEEPEDFLLVIEPDPYLQLSILREMTHSMRTQADANLILHIAQEGMHRGIGLDRVLVAILSSDRMRIKTKFVLEVTPTRLGDNFSFHLVSDSCGLLSRVLKKQESIWVGDTDNPQHKRLLSPALIHRFGSQEFFMAPILVGTREIGVFYADRQTTKRSLGRREFEAFQHFATLSGLCLELVTVHAKANLAITNANGKST